MYKYKILIVFIIASQILLRWPIKVYAEEAIPAYRVAEIPPQTYHFNPKLREQPIVRFLVLPSRVGSKISFTLDKPVASVKCELSIQNVFSLQFTADTEIDDGTVYTVTLAEKLEAQPDIVQVVSFKILRDLPPENEIVASDPSKTRPPVAGSTNYITISKSVNQGLRDFNMDERTVTTLDISGKEITLDARNDFNNLHSLLNAEPAKTGSISDVTIEAETIVLRSRLNIPQANVNLFARWLRFDDRENEIPASIVTTPAALEKATQFTPQAKTGYPAGSVNLRVGNIEGLRDNRLRFIASGGKGEDAGVGRKGNPGHSVTAVPNAESHTGPLAALGYDAKHLVYWEDRYTRAVVDHGLPENGEDAVAAGKRGDGGRGGNLASTIVIDRPYQDLSGGSMGSIGDFYEGGDPGTPNPAIGASATLTRTENEDGRGRIHPHYGPPFTEYRAWVKAYLRPGRGAYPPQSGNAGKAGTFTLLNDDPNTAWITPHVLSAILAHAKDLYLSGYLSEADSIFQDYLNLLKPLVDDPQGRPGQEAAEIAGYYLQFSQLHEQIASNKDFFGNPAGWVPLLSLGANLANYTAELDYSIKAMYLSYWISSRKADRTQLVAGMRESRSTLNKQIEQVSKDYLKLQNTLPDLQHQLSVLENEQDLLNQSILQKDTELKAQVDRKLEDKNKLPIWKKAASVLSVACKVIPVYQPALGAVGTGLGVLANVDTNKPLDTLQKLSDLDSEFKQSKFLESQQDLQKFLNTIDSDKAEDTKEYILSLAKITPKFASALNQISQSMRARSIPQSEFEAELELVKQTSPEYAELVEKARTLATKRAGTAMLLTTAIAQVTELTTQLHSNLVAVDKINTALAEQNQILDNEALSYIKDIALRAKERLNRYQYYIVKSYEYRFLESYPAADYNLNNVVEKLREIVKPTESSAIISGPDFDRLKGVYEESLRSALNDAKQRLQHTPAEKSGKYYIALTQKEVEELNTMNKVEIDLNNRLEWDVRQENRRIAALQVEKITCDHEAMEPSGIDLSITHTGISILRKGAQTYMFDHRTNPNAQPFEWTTTYQTGLPGGKENLSAHAISIDWLKDALAVLGLPGSESVFIEYVRPAADTTVTIYRKDLQGPRLQLKDLVLSLEVEYFKGNGDNGLLRIRSTNGITPYIKCDLEDKRGLKDGIGTFTRIYEKNKQVNVTAPAKYGDTTFDKWVDGAGKEYPKGNSRTISIKIDNSITVTPTYK